MAAVDETRSLEETVERIMRDNTPDVLEILITAAPFATPGCRDAIGRMRSMYPEVVQVHEQSRLMHVGGAYQECFDLVRGDFTIIMSSDLETPPALISGMIARARAGGTDIVTADRWARTGGFAGYAPVKLIFNYLFQTFLRVLYGTRLQDLTYGFRLYRTQVLQNIRWDELRHPFFLEALLKPLRLGCRITTLPADWTPRTQGRSSVRFSDFLRYLVVGLKIRFMPRRRMLRSGAVSLSGEAAE